MAKGMFTRDTILNDITGFVIDLSLNNGNTYRLTLRQDLIPPSFNAEEAKTYYDANRDFIIAWEVQRRAWIQFSANDVTYVQIVDSF